MSLEAQSDVDDLCSEVHAKFPQLTGISAAELIVSWEGAPLDPSNQWRRDAPLTDVRTTCDSPLYIHAPTTEVRRPAHTALHLARVAPGARTRGAARAIPCPPQPCTPPALLPRRRFCHVAPPSQSAADGLASEDEVRARALDEVRARASRLHPVPSPAVSHLQSCSSCS